jgi:hypothetical protein
MFELLWNQKSHFQAQNNNRIYLDTHGSHLHSIQGVEGIQWIFLLVFNI